MTGTPMITSTRVIANTYRDSVGLMQVSATLAETKGVQQASLVMATPANLDLLREAGLVDGPVAAGASDLLVVVRAASQAVADGVIARAVAILGESRGGSGLTAGRIAPRSLAMALEEAEGVNLALVSVPGEYAATEAHKALDAGLNVMLFSDNVSVADEVALKRKAGERKLMVMGPDCGTAIIDGVPLGFANVVRRGSIGCIAASGTGLQAVTTLIDRAGEGVSQAIGTGGRDLSEAVGGRTMLEGLKRLARDRATQVIVLVAKPPHPAVAAKLVAAAGKAGKPVVLHFIGARPADLPANVTPAATLDHAAAVAVALVRGRRVPPVRRASIPAKLPRLAAAQRQVRALYSGGTFAYEATLLATGALGEVWSNTPIGDDAVLDDPWHSRGHTIVDLGDDTFTRGRPHPMIDPRLRNERIVQEAGDPSVAVILFDVVLGHGSHADPAGAVVGAITAARTKAAKAGRKVAFVGFVCGTEADPQGLSHQEATLAAAGVLLAATNAEAVKLACAVATRGATAAKGVRR